MRLLTLLAMLAVTGCYDPSVADCQFTCGASQDCPDGASCSAGFCRTRSTGTCAAAVDAADSCPGAPASPTGCDMRFTLGGSACGVLCDKPQRAWQDAFLACMPGWQLAVLDTLGRRNAVPISGDSYWVGARRATPISPWLWTTGLPVEDSAWDGSVTPGDGVGEDCAVLDRQLGRLVNDRPCTDPERYICAYP